MRAILVIAVVLVVAIRFFLFAIQMAQGGETRRLLPKGLRGWLLGERRDRHA